MSGSWSVLRPEEALDRVSKRLHSTRVPPRQVSLMSEQEQTRLRHVFQDLVRYRKQRRMKAKLSAKLERLDQLNAHVRMPNAIDVYGRPGRNDRRTNPAILSKHGSSAKLSDDDVRVERDKLREQVAAIRAKLAKLRNGTLEHGTISASDVRHCFARHGVRKTYKEAEELVWEVDENLDGVVSFVECERAYNRMLSDRSGEEPAGLFDLLSFLCVDVDDSGQVSVDEAMSSFYTRFGRSGMVEQTRALFCGDDDYSGQIEFKEYSIVLSQQREDLRAGRVKGSIADRSTNLKLKTPEALPALSPTRSPRASSAKSSAAKRRGRRSPRSPRKPRGSCTASPRKTRSSQQFDALLGGR